MQLSSTSRPVVILSHGFQVMCDTKTDGGGWTLIQRRFNGHLHFYRGWEQYKHGFGDFENGEFYLGNEKIHELVMSTPHELRVDFKYNGTDYFAKYASFKLSSESDGYRLKVKGYSGNAGNALKMQHDNEMFSTFDRDNDALDGDSCARIYRGAWWYGKCQDSNLNGVWGSKEFGKGITWCPTTGYRESATFTEMKIRPRR
ncbi:ficolin-1-like [Physella acuta]|uniref:ficolin-1-like n=1 Tax=Physella acuta TaxID=109671 RepID=UPI0027DDDC41|nr:ficolin-1-like [Physella acuta]